jgi:secreted PhoX family phosphatase
VNPATVRNGLGWFQHEAAACDPVGQAVYMTEDKADGGFYRFVPVTWTDLSAGTLQILADQGAGSTWVDVPNPTPTAAQTSTRYQVAGTVTFNGGEGCWYNNGLVYFTTKGDSKVWAYRPSTNTLSTVYDANTNSNPVLTGVDNVVVKASRADVFVAEDGGNMQICMITSAGQTGEVVELTGVTGSEMAGPAFDPSGTRLYFSSQRNPGRTYEVSGPWK